MTWLHLYQLKDGRYVACRWHQLCPACRLKVRLRMKPRVNLRLVRRYKPAEAFVLPRLEVRQNSQ